VSFEKSFNKTLEEKQSSLQQKSFKTFNKVKKQVLLNKKQVTDSQV